MRTVRFNLKLQGRPGALSKLHSRGAAARTHKLGSFPSSGNPGSCTPLQVLYCRDRKSTRVVVLAPWALYCGPTAAVHLAGSKSV